MQPGVREFHLGLHPDSPQDAESRRALSEVLKQRRLAHAGLTAQHEPLALAPPDRLEQAVKPLGLTAAADELCRVSPAWII